MASTTSITLREGANNVANFGKPTPGQSTPQSNAQSEVASPGIAGYAAIACLRCKKQHKKCDKELPACGSCRKATAAEREAPDYVCNYDYSVYPGGRIEANASSASRTPARDSRSDADRAATSGKNALRKLEIDRLRKIFLHCCERDLEIIPNIPSSDKSFFKPNWSKEFEVVAPPEEKVLFETDMWTWASVKFCLIPLFMKDSVIKMRRRGEFSSVPFFFRQNYEKQAEDGKDGWEEMFGERPTMKDVQALLEASDSAATAQKRARAHSDTMMDYEDDKVAIRESTATRRRLNSDSRSTPTSHHHHHHHRHSASETKSPTLSTPIIRLYSSSRPRPSPSSSATPTTSNTASLYSTFIEMITSIQDIIDMLNHEKDKVSKLAAQTSDEFVKGALEDTCVELQKRVEGLRKAEADIQGSDIGPAVKKMLLRNLAKRATDEIEHQGL